MSQTKQQTNLTIQQVNQYQYRLGMLEQEYYQLHQYLCNLEQQRLYNQSVYNCGGCTYKQMQAENKKVINEKQRVGRQQRKINEEANKIIAIINKTGSYCIQ